MSNEELSEPQSLVNPFENHDDIYWKLKVLIFSPYEYDWMTDEMEVEAQDLLDKVFMEFNRDMHGQSCGGGDPVVFYFHKDELSLAAANVEEIWKRCKYIESVGVEPWQIVNGMPS